MIAEATAQRIAVALETLIVLLEKAAHPPAIVGKPGSTFGGGGVVYLSDARDQSQKPRPCDDTEGR